MKCALQRRVYWDGTQTFPSPATGARLIVALVHRSIGTAYQIELCNGGLENPVEIRPASSLDQKCHERFTYSPI